MFKPAFDFIREQFQTEDNIPLHAPVFLGKEKEYLNETIDSTFVSSVGPFVDRFEKDFATITQTKRAVAVVNGTAALQVCLQLAGVKPNDEVITQALTFIATANAISYLNAHPVFIDVDLDTMGLSPEKLKIFLKKNAEIKGGQCFNKFTGRRIAACMPMHTFGFPVHLEELVSICLEWNIPLVEDAAEAVGSSYKNIPLGGFGLLSAFSFNGNKTITSGGGGAIVTNHEDLGIMAKHLTTTAKIPHSFEFIHDAIGYNFRMPNVNAALAVAQLEMLPRILGNKRSLAHEYATYFKQIGIRFREELPETKANYWLMCIELANKNERDAFLSQSNAAGIMTRPIWQLLFKLPMYANCQRDDQSNALFLEDRIVNIPSSYRHGK